MAKSKVFQFSKRRVKKIKVDSPLPGYGTKTPDVIETPGMIQGRMAMSLNEWWVALALNMLGIEYQYQYEIFGGWRLRGGQSVDFLAYTVPKPTPIYVQGDYWHGGKKKAETEFKVAQANNYFKGWAQPVLEIWGHETEDRQMTYNTVKQKLLSPR